MGTSTLPPTLADRTRSGRLAPSSLWDTDVAGQVGERGSGGALDQLAGFNPAIVNVRLATTAASLVLSANAYAAADWRVIGASLLVVGNTGYRCLIPLAYTGSPGGQLQLLVEVILIWTLLAFTGFWQSPLVIALCAGLVVAGFAGGFRLALRLGASATISLTIVGFAVTEWTPERMSEAIQWSTLLLMTTVIAAYSRRISGEASRRNSANLDRISQLTDANTLLYNLHRLAQTLPASLDRTEVLESSLVKLRGLLPFERAAILLVDEADGTWSVARRQAIELDGPLASHDLPGTIRRCLATGRTAHQPEGGLQGQGLHPESDGGLYAPLVTRGRLVGLVAIESSSHRYREPDLRAFQAFIEPLALAIDNAGLFSRLHQASVAEERSRIARDLHDRIGQSLAALGFEVDRLVRLDDNGDDLGPGLAELREGVRTATTEVREALYDLRSDVADAKDLAHVITEFAERLAARSGLTIHLDLRGSERLALLPEREMWRIAQEAMINVERHAAASTMTVRWRCDANAAELSIDDDGRGMEPGRSGRDDSYGIVGMRERASSIGAALEIKSQPGEGTTVRCYLSQT